MRRVEVGDVVTIRKKMEALPVTRYGKSDLAHRSLQALIDGGWEVISIEPVSETTTEKTKVR